MNPDRVAMTLAPVAAAVEAAVKARRFPYATRSAVVRTPHLSGLPKLSSYSARLPRVTAPKLSRYLTRY